MFDRVIENWLTRLNERMLEIPFCQLLTSEGYQVVHLTRHGPQEDGKDILAIAPDGTPCAYQLKSVKGGKLSQSAWAKYVEQADRLVRLPIVHPSIDPRQPRRVFFVLNGELEEEVRTQIVLLNDQWKSQSLPSLEVIVKGDLFKRFKNINTNFWPITLSSEKTLLEFFLSPGNGYLDKGKFAEFILSLVPLLENGPRNLDSSRFLASAAILSTYALLPYYEQENHVAIIEGWVVFASTLIAFVEKNSFEKDYWFDTLSVALLAIEQAFENLVVELKERKNFLQGNPLSDLPFYQGRTTWLVGLVAAYAIWTSLRNSEKDHQWFKEFVTQYILKGHLWGEGAVPQYLSGIWFLRRTIGSREPDILLHQLIQAICKLNKDGSGLANPYKGLPEVVLETNGLSDSMKSEHYKGRSYTLEALIQLLVRRNWRRPIRDMWFDITHIELVEVIPDEPWQMCLWHIEEQGKFYSLMPKTPQSWAELRQQSHEVDLNLIPRAFQEYPELFLLFTIVYPQRLTKNTAKFLDSALDRRNIRKRE